MNAQITELTMKELEKIIGGNSALDPEKVKSFVIRLKSLKKQGYSEQEAKAKMYSFPGFTTMMVDTLVAVYWARI